MRIEWCNGKWISLPPNALLAKFLAVAAFGRSGEEPIHGLHSFGIDEFDLYLAFTGSVIRDELLAS